MSKPNYDSHLNDAEWQQIEPLLPPEKPLGNHRSVSLQAVVNAIFYRADNGIKWRNLPSGFPAWQTVYGYYRLWVRLGVWEQINLALVKQGLCRKNFLRTNNRYRLHSLKQQFQILLQSTWLERHYPLVQFLSLALCQSCSSPRFRSTFFSRY